MYEILLEIKEELTNHPWRTIKTFLEIIVVFAFCIGMIIFASNLGSIPNEQELSTQGDEKYKLGDYSGAISDYNKAIEIDSNNVHAYAGRGNAKYNLKDYYGAISDCNKAIKISSK